MPAGSWGRCYAFDVAFFVMAPVMTLHLPLGPLLFGIVWTIVLVMLGLHLRRQGQVIAAERRAASVPSSQAETLQYKEHKQQAQG